MVRICCLPLLTISAQSSLYDIIMMYCISMDTELIRFFESLDTSSNVNKLLVKPKLGETNHLEFKRKSDSTTPSLSSNDKKHFSASLSSFSNAEGGLLIWGISTKKIDGRDAASSLKPIAHVEEFAERLRDSLLDATMPKNHKVKIKTVKNREGNGFVICLIPSGDDLPVRAMLADREYFTRMDGRNMRLEHYQIRDLMLRRNHPDLSLSIKTSLNDLPDGQIRLTFSFMNEGKTLAKFCGWFLQAIDFKVISLSGCRDESTANDGVTCIAYDGGFNTVIHPNGIENQVGVVVLDRTHYISGLVMVGVKWYCEDMSTKVRDFLIDLPPYRPPITVEENT